MGISIEIQNLVDKIFNDKCGSEKERNLGIIIILILIIYVINIFYKIFNIILIGLRYGLYDRLKKYDLLNKSVTHKCLIINLMIHIIEFEILILGFMFIRASAYRCRSIMGIMTIICLFSVIKIFKDIIFRLFRCNIYISDKSNINDNIEVHEFDLSFPPSELDNLHAEEEPRQRGELEEDPDVVD
jgi:hypothetical protein